MFHGLDQVPQEEEHLPESRALAAAFEGVKVAEMAGWGKGTAYPFSWLKNLTLPSKICSIPLSPPPDPPGRDQALPADALKLVAG